MAKVYIYPYTMGSGSVALLTKGLNAKVIRLENSGFKGGEGKIVINWGNSMEKAEFANTVVVNPPEAVKLATNKRTFFEAVVGQVSIPEFTTDHTFADAWVRDGKKVVVREKLTGHSGEGIVLINNIQDWTSYDHSRAKLYVMYIPKKDEYRVHVMGGEVIDLQRKAIMPGLDKTQVNFQIRNHNNGFIFVRNETADRCPEDVKTQAIEAVRLTGLDFGAVDVVWNEHRKAAYVLEINTAPGLEGQTVTTYLEALDRIYLQSPLENRRKPPTFGNVAPVEFTWVINSDPFNMGQPVEPQN
jgi:glutathione synthase/RimK-type ligase-like ATP-grasp enzyme